MENVVLLGGCPSRILGDLLHRTSVSGAKSGSSAEDISCAPTAVGVYRKRRPDWDRQKITIATRDISNCCEAGSALFTMGMHMHTCLPWPIPTPSWSESLGPQEVFGGS